MYAGRPLLLLAAVLVTAETKAQADSATTPTRRSPFDIFAGAGVGGWTGSAGLGAAGGFSPVGLGIEKRLGSRHALRFELARRISGGELGRTGVAQSPATVWVGFESVSGHVRRYGPRGLVLGVGGSFSVRSSCAVDSRNGSGPTGSDVVSCRDFTDPGVHAKSIASQAVVTAGIEGRRLGLDLRLDQDLFPTVESSRGTARISQLSLVAHIWLRRRA